MAGADLNSKVPKNSFFINIQRKIGNKSYIMQYQKTLGRLQGLH